MNIIEVIVNKNADMNGGLAIIFGTFVIISSLLFSKSYIPQLGFIGSLQYMHIELVEGKTVAPVFETLPGVPNKTTGVTWPQINIIKEGYQEPPIRIPTKYLLFIGFGFIAFGIYTRINKNHKS